MGFKSLSNFLLLLITLFLCTPVHIYLLGKFLEVKLLGQRVSVL